MAKRKWAILEEIPDRARRLDLRRMSIIRTMMTRANPSGTLT